MNPKAQFYYSELVAYRNRYRTSHVLHLLLSLITAGLWIPVWLLVTLSNAIERGKVDRAIRKVLEG